MLPKRLAPRGLFVTGTDTEVGKTVVAAAIAATLAALGERVSVFKPVVTGLDDRDGSGGGPPAPAGCGALCPATVGDLSLPLRPARVPAPGRCGSG